MDRTRSFLQAVLGFDDRMNVRGVAKSDLIDEDRRKWFCGLMRARMARRLAKGVYAMAHPYAVMSVGRLLDPPPFEIAAALSRLNRRNMAIPMDVAEFVLGLRHRPCLYDVVGPFGWDGDKRLEAAGVVLEPVDPRIVALSPAGQAVALAGSRVAEESLREAANGVLASTRQWLIADLPSMTAEERVVAEAILAVPVGVPRKAPEGFVPPSGACPTVHGWKVVCFGDASAGGAEVITADCVTGHPVLGDAPFSHSSLLVWIDEELGWARTLSRYYRLGERACG